MLEFPAISKQSSKVQVNLAYVAQSFRDSSKDFTFVYTLFADALQDDASLLETFLRDRRSLSVTLRCGSLVLEGERGECYG